MKFDAALWYLLALVTLLAAWLVWQFSISSMPEQDQRAGRMARVAGGL